MGRKDEHPRATNDAVALTPPLAEVQREAGGSAAASKIVHWARMAVLVAAAMVPGTTINGCGTDDHEKGSRPESHALLNGIGPVSLDTTGATIHTNFERKTEIHVTLLSMSGDELETYDFSVGPGTEPVSLNFRSRAPDLSTLEVRIENESIPLSYPVEDGDPIPDMPTKGDGS